MLLNNRKTSSNMANNISNKMHNISAAISPQPAVVSLPALGRVPGLVQRVEPRGSHGAHIRPSTDRGVGPAKRRPNASCDVAVGPLAFDWPRRRNKSLAPKGHGRWVR
jgi:hypothetical protein